MAKLVKTTTKTIDLTNGKRPGIGEEYNLLAEFHNGQIFSYYGKTKKECLDKLKKKYGNTNGFKKLEWIILEE